MSFEFLLKVDATTPLFDGNPQGGCVASSGTRMYRCGDYAIHGYTLASANDPSTLSYNGYLEVWSNSSQPYGVDFKPDGTRMYVASAGDSCISEYLLGTPWDEQTAVYQRKLVLPDYPTGLSISPDGLKVFVCHQNAWEMTEYTLSEAWNISSGSLTHTLAHSVMYDLDEQPRDCWLSPDGVFCFVLTYYTVGVTKLEMSTPWVLSTATRTDRPWTEAAGDPNNDILETGLSLSADETNLYLFGWDNTGSNPTVWQLLGDGRAPSLFWTKFRDQSEIIE